MPLPPLLLRRRLRLACVLCIVPSAVLGAQPAPQSLIDLTLEQLGNYEITSVSKKSERLADAAASIYVITGEAIARAGVSSLPEALRLAPNLLVARVNSYQYAISARGFNSTSANKLLVMIDGRSIYTPLYSGVFWDANDVLLAEVERIEVISGSGGTLWGVNAVNGIINIITRRARAEAGELLQAGAGPRGQDAGWRHSGALEDGAYRIFAQQRRFRHSDTAAGAAYPDGWQHSQLGFRTDTASFDGELMLRGDAYVDAIAQAAPGTQRNHGASLVARWERSLADAAGWRLQAYYDHTGRDTPGTYAERLGVFDLELQYAAPAGGGAQSIFGGGYRHAQDHVRNSTVLAFLPADRRLQWSNLFAQHERQLGPALRLTAGLRAEYNSYSGLDYLPSLRLAWNSAPDVLWWGALARAVRAPARLDRDFYVPAVAPFALAGGPEFRSETATTLDLGRRARSGALSYSLTAFYSRYGQLRSLDLGANKVYTLGNQLRGHTVGLEAWAALQVSNSWSVDGAYFGMHERFGGAATPQAAPGNDPANQWRLGAHGKLGQGGELNLALRHVAALPKPAIGAYTSLDLNYAWRLAPGWRLAAGVQNLGKAGHAEFSPSSNTAPANLLMVQRALRLSLEAHY